MLGILSDCCKPCEKKLGIYLPTEKVKVKTMLKEVKVKTDSYETHSKTTMQG